MSFNQDNGYTVPSTVRVVGFQLMFTSSPSSILINIKETKFYALT